MVIKHVLVVVLEIMHRVKHSDTLKCAYPFKVALPFRHSLKKFSTETGLEPGVRKY